MPYYTPLHRAVQHPQIARPTTHEEWYRAMERASAAGLVNLEPHAGRPHPRSGGAPHLI